MFTGKINYLTGTLYALGGVLILILIIVVIWRFYFAKPLNSKAMNSKDLVVSNKLIDLSTQIFSINKIPSLVNILIKNRFSDKKYSVIPMMIFHGKNAFLIWNPIQNKNDTDTKIIDKNLIIGSGKKTKEVDLRPIGDLLRFFKSISLNVEVIFPTYNQKHTKKDNYYFVPTYDIGEFIEKYDREINENNVIDYIDKVKKLNIYKTRTTKRGRNV